MSITNDLSKILEIKEDIYNAISNKEVSIPENTPFEEYASKIASIQVGGDCSILRINPTPSDATVAFTNSKGESIPNFYNQAACSTGKTLSCTISKTGYRTYHNDYVLNQNTESSITLTEKPHKFYTDGQGILCLTDAGNLYGSGEANPNYDLYDSSKRYFPYFELLDTNVSDCCFGDRQCTYVKNGDLYFHGMLGKNTWIKEYTKMASNVKKLGNNRSSNVVSYIDINDDLYLFGSSYHGEQGIPPSSPNWITTPTKRASNVKDCGSFYNGVSYYIDNNNDLYMCGNGDFQGSGTSTNITSFTKRASNVKKSVYVCRILAFAYITNNNELYLTSYNSEYKDYKWHKIADNVRDAKITGANGSSAILFYIDFDNNLYGYSLGDITQPNPMGDGSSSGRAYRVKVGSDVDYVITDVSLSAYVTTNKEVYTSGNSSLPLTTSASNIFVKNGINNLDTLYDLYNPYANIEYIYYSSDGYYYAAGHNESGMLGIDNGGKYIKEFTRIYPTGV